MATVFTANTILPALTSESAAGLGSAASALPMVQASATGKAYWAGGMVLPALEGVGYDRSGRGSGVLPALEGQGTLVSGAYAVAAITLPMLTGTGSGYRGGYARSVLPALEASGRGYAEIAFTAGNELPMILTGPAFVLRALQELYETWAVDAVSKAHTEYDGFTFNSFGVIDGVTYAANPNGIYALGGDDDAGTAIDAEVMFGETDFYYDGESWGLKGQDADKKKRMHTAYVMIRKRGDKTPEVALLLKVDEDKYREYTVDLSADPEGMVRKRIRDIGRGLTGRFWQPGFKNINGSDFEVEKIDLFPIILSR